MYRESRIISVPEARLIRGVLQNGWKKKGLLYEWQLLGMFYMDNCGVHAGTTESKESAVEINDQIRKLVANAMNLMQPLHLFAISKIKYVWR